MQTASSSRKCIERKGALLHFLQKNEVVSIDELAQQMEVSSSTLRCELRFNWYH
jgi:DeoR/GlpR family transcriptional regulator of sugar metabolism